MKVAWERTSTAHTSCIRVLELNQAAFSGALHAHEALELTWIRSGQGLRFVSENVEPFQAGDLVLVAPECAHTWQSVGPRKEAAQAIVMQVLNHDCLRALPGWGDVQARIWEGQSAAWVIEGHTKAVIVRHLQSMVHAGELDRVGHAVSILAQCAQHLHTSGNIQRLGTRTRVSARAGSGDRRHRIERLLRWTHQHLETPITAAQAAPLLHVSTAAFSRAFKQAVGKPYSEYLNDLRVAQACLQLLQSERPISDIALRSGFLTLSHFHEQFSRRTGLSPRQYRLQGKEPVHLISREGSRLSHESE